MQQTSAGSAIVVGGGVAGLICAIELHRAGRSVLVLEAGDDVGGRVRTSIVDGFRVDHGFQVLFTAYPTLASYLDMPSLSLRKFQPAARIVRDGRVSLIGDAMRDPFGDPGLLLDTVLARAIPLGDKLRLLALRRFASSLSIDECFSARYDALTTREFLRGRGFSDDVVDGFFAPFYGGILLDRTLGTSASVLLFTFKMLAAGDTAVPAHGIGAITAHLASQLPAGSVRVGVPVASIDAAEGRVRGVALLDGSHFEANDVVLATDAPAAARLARTIDIALPVPAGARGCTTVYYTATRSPLPGRALWLQGDPQGVIGHAVTLTDVAPDYAIPGSASGSRALLAATAVGDAADLDDEALDTGARRDIAAMALASGDRGLASERLTRLAVWRVPYAQFAQPPGWREHRPTISCGVPGLWRASEVLHSSSLEGAARGGRDAARVLLQQSHSGHSGHHA